LKELMDRIERHHTGFFMAGNYRQGVPVRDVISSGYKAAEDIVQALSR